LEKAAFYLEFRYNNFSEGDNMAGKIQLKLKKKETAPTAAPAPGAAPAAASAFAMPTSSAGGLVLELRGASIHISEVVIKPKK
jgi:hypothetical protein